MSIPQLRHNGLFELPSPRRGIYWLRLYRGAGAGFVAVVTEVPGNPGMSVTNASSRIAQEVADHFGINPKELDLFIIWPRLRLLGGPAQHD